MRILMAMAILLGLSLSAFADGCVSVKGSKLFNDCRTCMKITLTERRSASAAGQAAVEQRQDLTPITLQPGQHVVLPAGAQAAVVDIAVCR